MSASGMPLTLADGRITRIREGVDSLNVQTIIPSITDATLEVASNGTGELHFATDGARAITVDSSQNVGVGVPTSIAGRLHLRVADTENLVGLNIEQNDTTNDPDAVKITNAGAGAALELAGAGSRLINSTAGDLTVRTETSGDMYLTSAGDADLTAQSIVIHAQDAAGNLEITGESDVMVTGKSTLGLSSVAITASPFDDITGTFFKVAHDSTGQLVSSSGRDVWMDINPDINQTDTAGYTALQINAIHTAIGSGTQLLLDAQVGGGSKFTVHADGVVDVYGKITAGASDLTFEGRSSSITLNESGHTALSGFTNTSIVGALNELKSTPTVSQNSRWLADVDAGSVSQYELVGADATAAAGHVRLSDANGAPKNCVGVSITSGTVTAGNEITVASSGRVSVKTSDAGAWTMSDPVYMSQTAGEVTDDISGLTVGDIVQQIGFAIDTSTGTTREIILSLGPVITL